MPAVKRAASDIWAVSAIRRKALQLFGGDLAGNLIYPAMLGLCLLAFHQRLDFAELIVVQIGAGMLGSVAPVPGGIGVQEAALTAGLTSFGIPAAPALATVLVFRGDHVPDPAVLRLLHSPLAAHQGLRVTAPTQPASMRLAIRALLTQVRRRRQWVFITLSSMSP